MEWETDSKAGISFALEKVPTPEKESTNRRAATKH
jgi:hypothetical protein